MKSVFLIGFLLFLLAFGSYCLFFPKKVQEIAAKSITTGVTAKSSALKSYVQSKSYKFGVRAIGLISYLIALLLIVALYKSWS